MRIGDSVDRSCTTPLCRLRSKTAIGNESRRSDPQSWSDSSSDGADNSGFRDQQTRNVGQSRTDKRRRSAYNSASCRSTIRTSHAARPRERYAALRPEPRIRARGSLRSNSTSEVNRRLGSTAATIATHRARIGGGLGTRQGCCLCSPKTCEREPSHLLDAHAAIRTPWAKKDHRSARIHAATFQRTTRELPVIGRSSLDADCFMPRGGALRERPGWRFLFSYRGPAARISFALAPLSAGSESVRRRSSRRCGTGGTGQVQKGDRCLELVRP